MKEGLIGLAIGVVVFIIMLSVVWSTQSTATNFETQTQTFTIPQVSSNITLTGNDPQALTSIVNASGTAIAASNYTSHIADGYITFNGNVTKYFGTGSGTITYTNQQEAYISDSITRTIIGFVTVLLGAVLLYMISGIFRN